jgi:hypothetical protein
MNLLKLQADYVFKKAAYDNAFEKKDWVRVDELEDPYLEAEFALFDEVGKIVVATGEMTEEDVEYIRRHSNIEQWKKLIDLGLRLQA